MKNNIYSGTCFQDDSNVEDDGDHVVDKDAATD